MISKFRIKNFRSIVDLTLDFSYGEGKAPNGYKTMDTHPFLKAPNGERLVPCMAFFGANASGKSTIMYAFIRLQRILEKGLRDKESIMYTPNALHPELTSTIFEITYFIRLDKNNEKKEQKSVYRIEYNQTGIINESLACDDKIIYQIQNGIGFFPGIIDKDYSPERLQKIIQIECSDAINHQNFTLLKTLYTNYTQLSDSVIVANWGLMNMICSSNVGANYYKSLSNIIHNNGDAFENKMKERLFELIQRMDIDIKGFSFEYDFLKRRRLMSHHEDVNGNIIKFDFLESESDGTCVLLLLLYELDFVLQFGGVYIVDELDCSLHPRIVRELIKIIKLKRYNKNNAQLIFTSHTTDILEDELMRVSEITVVNKNTKYGTKAHRVVDIKREFGDLDIRNVTNFRKQYVQGFYTGVPHPTI